MNNKGFTLVELLATIIVLSLVVGISVGVMNVNLGKTKEKTEEVFVDTIKDAVDMYLSSNPSELKFIDLCSNKLNKKYGEIKVYKARKNDATSITFQDVISSKYVPLTKSEFVNPANEDVACNVNAEIDIYRDDDFVYYYSIDKSNLSCLKNIGGEYKTVISNLPEGYSCE